MEIKIIKDIENKLFNRKEISGEVNLQASPTNLEILKLISEKFSVPEDAIKIKGIYGKFGTNNFKIEANIYPSKQDKEKIEHKTKKEIEAEKKAEEEHKKAEEEKKKAVEEAKAAEKEKQESESTENPEEKNSEEEKKE